MSIGVKTKDPHSGSTGFLIFSVKGTGTVVMQKKFLYILHSFLIHIVCLNAICNSYTVYRINSGTINKLFGISGFENCLYHIGYYL